MIKSSFVLLLLLILSFATSPDTIWTARYNGIANLHDKGRDIALDNIGNVYVTGSSQSFSGADGNDYLSIKYSADGDTLWTKRFNCSSNAGDSACGIAVDKDSNWVYVTGYCSGDTLFGYGYYTIKYNTDGDTIWTRTYNRNSPVAAQAIDIDMFGIIYITGYCYFANSYNYLTVRYTPNGDTLLSHSYNSPNNRHDYAYGVAVDTFGSFYVTGSAGNPSGHYLTIKYDCANTVWHWERSDSIEEHNFARAVAADNMGNIYVTGYVGNGSTLWDIWTIKYNTNGDTLWTRRYNDSQGLNTQAYGIAVDSFGDIYIAGVVMNVPGTSHDYLIIKYNSNGDTVWTTTYNSPYSNVDIAYGITVDDSGYIYVSGASLNSANKYDYLTIKYYDNTYAVNENAFNNSIIKPMLFLFPNPTFNQVAIHYNLRKESNVTIKIYDVSGKMIKSIYNGNQKAGVYTKYWNGMITKNTKAPCGVYFCQLEADNFNSTAKLILLK